MSLDEIDIGYPPLRCHVFCIMANHGLTGLIEERKQKDVKSERFETINLQITQ